MKAKGKQTRALETFQAIIAEAIQRGADSIELEYMDEGLEVTQMLGSMGLGQVLTDRALAGELLGLITALARLEHKPRGVIEWTWDGQPYPIRVEEYDSFGESAFRLKLGKPEKQRDGQTRRLAPATQTSYTPLQGQYLAFIHYYTKIHGQPPAEADMERYFRVTPPTVHQMILTLERRGFISRQPRQPRSIRILLPLEQLPPLA